MNLAAELWVLLIDHQKKQNGGVLLDGCGNRVDFTSVTLGAILTSARKPLGGTMVSYTHAKPGKSSLLV